MEREQKVNSTHIHKLFEFGLDVEEGKLDSMDSLSYRTIGMKLRSPEKLKINTLRTCAPTESTSNLLVFTIVVSYHCVPWFSTC